MRVLLALTSSVVMGLSLLFASGKFQSPAPKAPDGPRQLWVKIVFGIDGQDAAWDGRLTVKNGRVLEMVGWGLEERDQLMSSSSSWKIANQSSSAE